MCGIVGIVGKIDKKEREDIVAQMNGAIYHRGPDQDGMYSDELATLAMRRLSIIDLKSGKQPIYNNAGNKLVFFNGEIYNYQDLRKELIGKGYKFLTTSDTECIIHLYDEYGEDCLAKLKGAFAFCIYELDTKKIFIARDRFGEKPLFFYHKDGLLVFSSEMKSLLQNRYVSRELDYESLPYYLKCSYVPQPRTLIKNVSVLPPGYKLVCRNGEVNIAPYFNVAYKVDKNIKSIKDAVDLVGPLFAKSVERQMLSDVPLGAFLSGGIDSSSIVAQMQSFSATPIKTFNVKFEEATYDESLIAKEVAQKIGTDHHEIFIPNANFDQDIFWTIIDHVGVPFPDSSAIPTWYITKEIKKHVTVALSGDGGDELFGGYSLFSWYKRILDIRKKVPAPVRSTALTGLGLLKKVSGNSKLRQLNKGLNLAGFTEKELAIEIHELFSNREIGQVVPGAKLDFVYLKNYPAEYAEWSDLRKIMYYRTKYNLPLDMLVKVDSMSMANSLEVRAPFLDVDLFEASCTLPDEFLRQNDKGKLVIRELMKDRIPDSVFNHPKSGFSIPLHKYQNKDFKFLCDDLLNKNRRISKVVPIQMIEAIKASGLNTTVSNSQISVYQASHKLWALLQLSGWMERFDIQL